VFTSNLLSVQELWKKLLNCKALKVIGWVVQKSYTVRKC